MEETTHTQTMVGLTGKLSGLPMVELLMVAVRGKGERATSLFMEFE